MTARKEQDILALLATAAEAAPEKLQKILSLGGGDVTTFMVGTSTEKVSGEVDLSRLGKVLAQKYNIADFSLKKGDMWVFSTHLELGSTYEVVPTSYGDATPTTFSTSQV